MKSESKHLILPFVMALGLALVVAWAAGASGTPAVAAPQDPVALAERRVCDTCAYTSVQAAVDAANPGDVIKVAADTYTGVSARPVPTGYANPPVSGLITQMVYVTKTVTIQGGYTKANWNTPDPTANPTTLDAGGAGRVFVIAGDINPTIQGLRIIGGDATGQGGSGGGGVGGGVYALNAHAAINGNQIANGVSEHGGGGVALYSSPSTLSGNTIVSNVGNYGGGLLLGTSAAVLDGNTVADNTAYQAGGGLYLYASPATVSGNVVYSNTASVEGGGLRLYDSDNATLTGNQVYSNTARFGGGIESAFSDNITLSDNVVRDNTAGIAANGFGGGLRIWSSENVVLNGNTVQGNVASTASAGEGGGLSFSDGSIALSNNIIRNNTASTVSTGRGGGLYLYRGTATLSGNTIVSNTATLYSAGPGDGGGVWVNGSNPLTLTNNLVAHNHAVTRGSGLWIDGYSPYLVAGRLLHNTIADNAGGCGQGVFVGDYTTLTGVDTIIAGHSSVGITVTAGSTVMLEATLWHANGANTAGVVDTGTINVNDDPVFVNPAVGDYHLGLGSHAIDAGVDAGVTRDIDGDVRPFGAGYDIGADEYGWPIYLPLVMRSYGP